MVTCDWIYLVFLVFCPISVSYGDISDEGIDGGDAVWRHSFIGETTEYTPTKLGHRWKGMGGGGGGGGAVVVEIVCCAVLIVPNYACFTLFFQLHSIYANVPVFFLIWKWMELPAVADKRHSECRVLPRPPSIVLSGIYSDPEVVRLPAESTLCMARMIVCVRVSVEMQ